jgi:hypothetical protein
LRQQVEPAQDYRAIDFAIERGLARVEAGAQGEHKVQRGYLPRPTWSAHWIAHPGLRRAVRRFLETERPAVEAEIRDLAADAPFRRGEDRLTGGVPQSGRQRRKS